METDNKESLVSRFRSYLDKVELEAAPSEGERRHADLFSLFVELAALKNEVKLESRQVKTALDEFKSIFDTLQTSHGQLTTELERCRAAQKEQQRIALRPLLLELLDLHDRLEAGVQTLHGYRGSGWFRKRETALIKAIGEGQEISLRRLQQLLSAHQVTAFETQGKPLDPHTMRAVEIAHRNDLDNGIVIEELRKGFSWDGELLRPAEVKVNKRSDENGSGAP